MVEGLNKISGITPKDTKLQAESYRKLIVSYSKDPRVTLIKLADRLEIMRNLDIFPKSSIMRKVTETIMLYIPLAHQLGLYNLKSELEDLYFRHSDPENYRAITNKLKATERDREKLAQEFVKPLEQSLNDSGIKYKLKVRTKTAYSIWKKMQKQNVPFEKVYDVFAMRFILDVPLEKEHDYCWEVYSRVTQEYKPDTKRLRDWITNPKPNGYESLHTTVQNKEGAYIEVQIRTARMDDMAENGHASHWSYKGIKSVQGLDEWLKNVKSMLESSEENPYTNAVQTELDEIFVFTPTGDLKQLPKGASVLDFAFNIHSNLGVKCSGARVNGKIASIKDELHTGDIVEIMSNKNQRPSADWLKIVVSSKARNRIKAKLKEEEGKLIKLGREMLERRMKNWKLELNDDVLADIAKHYKMKASAEVFLAIYEEKIDLIQLKDFLT
ncbi:MAG: bifunctional (p)ppGpp synthetase/guanosine-3',5'-bis(diphosphate) 3'-pyrophosphohydrolase, partial [Bacteroidales bacterium]|nr:bifunctional (p)ppGpp synthetase/guanosine-3',5'-bis(diphosphate) 3'-pyrophosphohydrolase [Bacteroidales bacterium]